MKRIMILIYILASTTVYGQSDEFKYGARFAMGESNFIPENFLVQDEGLNISGGVTTNYKVTKYLGIGADLSFATRGVAVRGVDIGGTTEFGEPIPYQYQKIYRSLFIELPVMGNITFPLTKIISVKGFAGPGVGVNVLSTESKVFLNNDFDDENGYMNRNVPDDKTFISNITYGLGLVFKSDNGSYFNVELRKGQHFTTFTKIKGQKMRYNYTTVSVSLFMN